MIVPPMTVKVLIATKSVDFRKGMDGLAALISAEFRLEPYTGVTYVFRAKRADRVKLLFWVGTGVCLLTKHLEGGKFRWPKVEDGVMRLSPAQLSALREGLAWSRVNAQRVVRPTSACLTLAADTSVSGHRSARERVGLIARVTKQS